MGAGIIWEISLPFSQFCCKSQIFLFFIFFNVYLLLRDRERQSVIRGGSEGEGDTESEAGSRL